MSIDFSRREFLTSAAAAGAAAMLQPAELLAQEKHDIPRLPFRFVHMTDIHVQNERNAAKGFAKALKAVEALKPRPDFILTGGDLVFDTLEVGPDRAKSLFELYKKVLADNTSLKVYNTVGNHDVFGWSGKNGVTPKTPGYGKAMVSEYLELPKTYYAFIHKGWKFIILDNIQPFSGKMYTGFVDKPQMEWFEAELKKPPGNLPIAICEHIPTLTVTPLAYESARKDGRIQIEGGLVCSDGVQRLKMIRNRHVKLWLSGHTHLLDSVEYYGTRFINAGAVSGSWWLGKREGIEEGFTILDVTPAGDVRHEYFDYGWDPEVKKPK